MNLEEGDELVSVAKLGEADEIIMVSEQGKAARFQVRNHPDDKKNLTPRSRSAGGVRGMKLSGDDKVVGMAPVIPNGNLLVVSRRGYGKSTPLDKYPVKGRGTQGVITFRVDDQTESIAAARVVTDDEGQEVFIISAKAQVVRINLQDVKVTDGRRTKGVIIWRDREPDDCVASVACFQETDYSSAGANGNAATGSANGANANGAAPVAAANGHQEGLPEDDAAAE